MFIGSPEVSVKLLLTTDKAQWSSDREVRSLHRSHAIILLGSNLGQVVYTHCLSSLLSSKKLGYKREYLDWTDLTALEIECV